MDKTEFCKIDTNSSANVASDAVPLTSQHMEIRKEEAWEEITTAKNHAGAGGGLKDNATTLQSSTQGSGIGSGNI